MMTNYISVIYNMKRVIYIIILIVLSCTSCRNTNLQTTYNTTKLHNDYTNVYMPDSDNRWGGEDMLLFYQYQDESDSDMHLTWDIYAHTLYYAHPSPTDFLAGRGIELTGINSHYSYYIAKSIYDYQTSQEGRTETDHPMYFWVYFVLIYPGDGKQLVFVGDDADTPGFGDLLINGKSYTDNKNLGDFIVEIISNHDNLFKEALSSAPFPFKIQYSKQLSINKTKEIKYIELYTNNSSNIRDRLHMPWSFPVAASSIHLTPERYYDIHREHLNHIVIDSQEDIDTLLNDSVQSVPSYVYFIIRVIYEDGSSSLRAISSKNKQALDVVSSYIQGAPWEEGPSSAHDKLIEE